jgi:hypothetical protein
VCPFSTNERLRGKRKNRPDHVFPGGSCRENGGISTLGSVRPGPGLFISGFTKKWRDLLSVSQNVTPDSHLHQVLGPMFGIRPLRSRMLHSVLLCCGLYILLLKNAGCPGGGFIMEAVIGGGSNIIEARNSFSKYYRCISMARFSFFADLLRLFCDSPLSGKLSAGLVRYGEFKKILILRPSSHLPVTT